MITLLYVRPASDDETELDRTVGVVAERYARWVELRVMCPEELTGRVVDARSPTLFLLRAGQVVSEAIGALLPVRELDRAVRQAVEWPVPSAA
ncbi:MAG TPA: hypothetical protein VMZ28_15835 [Kofleriaceae bacterium]|nr:hypothetical protein [Kofleriaceae bacterium]